MSKKEVLDKKELYDIASRIESDGNYTIDEANFLTPTMGDYFRDETDLKYLEKVEESLGESDNGYGALFYKEEPYSTTIGYHKDANVFIVKADPEFKNTTNDHYEELNIDDGDTVYFNFKSVQDNDIGFSIGKSSYTGVKDYIYQNSRLDPYDDKSTFGLRFIGIDTPEIPHYRLVSHSSIDKIHKFKEKDFNSNFMFDRTIKRDANKEYEFIKVNKSKYAEVINNSYSKDKYKLKNKRAVMVVSKDDSVQGETAKHKAGLESKKAVTKLLKDAVDMRIMIDGNSFSANSKYDNKKPDILDIFKYIEYELSEYNSSYGGFNSFGQDNYKRFLGTIYVKTSSGDWINVSKYVMAKYKEVEANPSIKNNPEEDMHYQYAADAFKLWSYNHNNFKIMDALVDLSKDSLDDRKKIQEDIMGRNFDDLMEYTVMIGDSLFMVPPTSIRTVSQMETERTPLLRSKGSMSKTTPKVDRIIEMTLYFNNDEGINGFPYKTKIANKETTCYMNGLRNLIAMFKYTPFLPVTNEYINKTLNVEAVSLMNLQISTVPGYPRCIAATITLQEFDYRVYMPELPVPDPDKNESLDKNMFASTINFEAMRWYYQRAIIRGNELRQVVTNSEEYIEKTLGSKTSLQPMYFGDSNIDFYIINKDYLEHLSQIKRESSRTPVKQSKSRSEAMIKLLESVADIFKQATVKNKKEIDLLLKKLNEGKLYTKHRNKSQTTSGGFDKSIILKEGKNEKEMAEEFVNPLLKEFSKSVRNVGVMEESVKKDNTVNYTMFINIDSLGLTNTELDLLKEVYAKDLSLKKGEFFKDNKVAITFTGKIDATGNLIEDIKLNKTTPDYKFMELSQYDSAGKLTDMEEHLSETKQSMDLEDAKSLKFDKYNVGDIKIKNVAAVFGNSMSKLNLQMSDGEAPQYAGGQDTIIEIAIETTDETSVNLINLLPKIGAKYARDYRNVLKTWPIRIDSEITRLLGVHEVLIETVDISTVPGNPGLFTVNLRLVSVDRTLRNKEALRKLDKPINTGKKDNDTAVSFQTKDFFDIKDTLSEVDIYPDLELPTIEEMEKDGLKFIKYSNPKDKRKYPDPDFYFYYGHVLGNEIFRDSILEYINTNSEKTAKFHIEDNYGAKFDIEPNDEIGYSVSNKNATLDQFESQARGIDELQSNIPKDDKESYITTAEAYKDLSASAINTAPDGQWDISEDIICTFRDRRLEGVITDEESELKEQLELRSDSIIKIIDEELNKAIDTSKKGKSYGGNKGWDSKQHIKHMNSPDAQSDYLKNSINDYTKDYFDKGEGSKILEHFGIDKGDKKEMLKNISLMISSSAAAASGKQEYSKDSTEIYKWGPRMYSTNVTKKDLTLIPDHKSTNTDSKGRLKPFAKVHVGGQLSKIDYAKDIDEAVKYGYEFGAFGIKAYTKKEMEKILEKRINIELPCYFLDPYYRTKQNGESTEDLIKRVNDHKFNLLTNPYYATSAFVREILFWIKELLNDKIIFSLYDLISDESVKHIDEKVQSSEGIWYPGASVDQKELDKIAPEEKKIAKAYSKIIKEQKGPRTLGKFFAPILLATTNGDKNLYSLYSERQYEVLNSYTQATRTGETITMASESSEANILFRRFILALSGNNVIDDIDTIGTSSINAKDIELNAMLENIYLKAADDPMIYLQHSFYDMIVNDKRGRMVRAFPTFYMVFIDEGREIGLWKLHDNFYSMSAIGEIQVTKSRKIAADTAKVVMSNMFNTYTTEDEDVKDVERYNQRDAFNSIFSPRTYYMKAELERINAQPVERARLSPGIRMHLRMGYGANASTLPVIFNGAVAEVGTGEVLELIAQGDGTELSNPILSNNDAEDIQFEGDFVLSRLFNKFLTEGATAKEILASILTSEGSFTQKTINNVFKGRFFNDNPYGITHFGEPKYNTIFKQGEVVQNLYESTTNPTWGKDSVEGLVGMSREYGLNKPPKLSTQVFGKSFWEIMHICAATSPDYITGIAPFQFRSTIFHGAPRYYYAYDYEKVSDESGYSMIKERRKPFQQYHIYTSYSDIVANTIKASEKDIKTAAVGLYSTTGWLGKESAKRVGPMFVDSDIYSEKQKTMTVDTQLLAKGTAAGDIIPFINWLQNELASAENSGGYELAWRMTANALKDSVKDMYQGEIIILGDPTVKPNDKVWINDTYEAMQGAFGVEAVVHNFTVQDGYTTSVYADCISTIDDRHELISQTIVNDVVGKSLGAYTILVGTSLAFAKQTKPLLGAAVLASKKTGAYVDTVIDSVVKLIGKEETMAGKRFSPALAKAFDKVSDVTGVAKMGPVAAMAVPMAVEFAATWVITSLAYEHVERWMRNLQVLQIFPLRKDGSPYTAGLNGHKGLVVGSSTYEDEGFMEGLLVKAFEKKEGLWGGFYNIARDLLTTDNMREIAEGYKRGIGIPESSMDTHREDFIQGLLKDRSFEEMQQQNSYYASLLIPRTKNSGIYKGKDNKTLTLEGSRFFKEEGVESTNNLGINKNITDNMVALTEVKELKKMKDNKELIFIHEELDETDSIYPDTELFRLEGKPTNIPVIVEEDSGIYDLPFLSKTANDLMMEIIHRTRKELKEPDVKPGEKTKLEKHHIIIKSALRAGEKQKGVPSLASAGYQFVIQAKGYNNITEIVKSLADEEKEVMKSLGKEAETKDNSANTFSWQEVSGDTIKILVYPPVNDKE